MRKNEITFTVRYGETDQMGVVYHGNYAQYLELGRLSWLKDLDVSYKKMEENGIILPVISLQINFKQSALYDDAITVVTRLKKRPAVKIEFDYEIFNEKGDLLVTANTVLAFLNKETKRPVKCPNYVLKKIDDFYDL
ncbi:MAG: thioesterase family protein [Cellulophaga sp.]|uniref:acyl-CoA thioesterase n=1 Tax=Cellulophaga sp. TaxID=1972202 RepID=UPI0032654794